MAKRYEWQFPITMQRLHNVLSDFFSNPIINVTTSTLATPTSYAEKVITLNRAAGVAVKLPPALATGDVYEFYVGTTFTSNATFTKAAGSSDTFIGMISTATTTAGNGLHEALGGADVTITLNGTTTGGIVGSVIKFRDIASAVWKVEGYLIGSGSLATSVS